jgi:choline dehydrogenase
MGLPATDDINGPQWEGMTINQITTRKGLRESASTAYLRPALKRSNLRLIAHALVERVEFEGQRASAVQFVVDGQRQVAHARREVLVCGGAVNSPALLQLSGVGDAEFLRGKGIAPTAVERAIKLSHDKYCSASIMLGKTAEITTSFEVIEV